MTPTRFDDRLLDALLDEYDFLTAPDAADPPSAPARTPRRPRAWLAGGALGAGAMTAAAAVALTVATAPTPRPALPARPARPARPAVPHRPGHPAPEPRAPGGAHPAPAPATGHDVAYVVRRLRRALDAGTDGDVLHLLIHEPDSQTGAPTVVESWSGGGSDANRTVTLGAGGRPVTGYLVSTTAGETTSLTVDYAARTWSEQTSAAGAGGARPSVGTPTQWAAQLRAEAASGALTLVGPRTVDGHPAIELRDTEGSSGTIELWVDPSSYLPLEQIELPAGATAQSPRAIRMRLQWLPATPADLAPLTPAAAIPAGFARLSDD